MCVVHGRVVFFKKNTKGAGLVIFFNKKLVIVVLETLLCNEG
jgi:hypothetical protein